DPCEVSCIFRYSCKNRVVETYLAAMIADCAGLYWKYIGKPLLQAGYCTMQPKHDGGTRQRRHLCTVLRPLHQQAATQAEAHAKRAGQK
ncbi:MAG: hypothetical protein ACKN9T_07955, partial [Candidatus Methylumidiphilus sp.]